MPESLSEQELQERYALAQDISSTAAEKALNFFVNREALSIESKGTQDWVSNADKDVESVIRAAIKKRFPDDTIIGEEHGQQEGGSGFKWVIDPIDGTSSFVNGIPGWCVVIAGVFAGKTVFGVIVDPVARENFTACRGESPQINGVPFKVSAATELGAGSVAVGHNVRFDYQQTIDFLSSFLAQGGMFYRNGSGAIMLAYVASGRLLGYVEPHMFAWDCLAGLFMIEQAGGEVKAFNHEQMLQSGGMVVAGAPGVYPILRQLTDKNFHDS